MPLNPLAEARAKLGDRYEVRVLEPAPPAITSEPFSDDPMARGEVRDGRTLVAPFETGVVGDLTWDALAHDDHQLAEWCAHRALAALAPPPPLTDVDAFVSTRLAWHALAEHVLCPARHRVNGKIGLRFTRGGFGTPFFGADDAQVRIEGTSLVHVVAGSAAASPVTTLGAAAAAIGIEAGAPDLFTPTTTLDLDWPLELAPLGVAVLEWWFGFAASVLAQLRADGESNAAGAPAPSLVQLWPEHFDLACDLTGAAAADVPSAGRDGAAHADATMETVRRANFGASPGDAAHPEPYLYVGPWDIAGVTGGPTPDSYWNEPFGASLPYSALVEAGSARDVALKFFRDGRDRLGG